MEKSHLVYFEKGSLSSLSKLKYQGNLFNLHEWLVLVQNLVTHGDMIKLLSVKSYQSPTLPPFLFIAVLYERG